jgi:pentatricopeptide repeat protein
LFRAAVSGGRSNHGQLALEEGFTPTIEVFNAMLNLCVINDQWQMAFELFQEMRESKNFHSLPDALTYELLLQACVQMQSSSASSSRATVSSALLRSDFDRDVHAGDVLKVVSRMLTEVNFRGLNKTHRMYECAMKVFVEARQLPPALSAIAAMRLERVERSPRIYALLLTLCGDLRDGLQAARVLVEAQQEQCCDSDVLTVGVRTFGLCGQAQQALYVCVCFM